jgi:hypothetical protein
MREPLPTYAIPFAGRMTRVVPGIASVATSEGGSTERSNNCTPYAVAAQRSLPSVAASRYEARKGAENAGVGVHCAGTRDAERRTQTRRTTTRPGMDEV